MLLFIFHRQHTTGEFKNSFSLNMAICIIQFIGTHVLTKRKDTSFVQYDLSLDALITDRLNSSDYPLPLLPHISISFFSASFKSVNSSIQINSYLELFTCLHLYFYNKEYTERWLKIVSCRTHVKKGYRHFTNCICPRPRVLYHAELRKYTPWNSVVGRCVERNFMQIGTNVIVVLFKNFLYH